MNFLGLSGQHLIKSTFRRMSTSSMSKLATMPASLRLMRYSISVPSKTMLKLSSRMFSNIRVTNISSELYAQESTEVFRSIVDRLENEDIDSNFENEIDFTSDVVNIRTHAGTWVLNKHNVTKQIWLSSPISGPSKYNYHIPSTSTLDDIQNNRVVNLRNGKWVSERDDTTSLSQLLQIEFSQAFQIPVTFSFKF